MSLTRFGLLVAGVGVVLASLGGCARSGITLANTSDVIVTTSVRAAEGVRLRDGTESGTSLGPLQLDALDSLTFSVQGSPTDANAPLARITVRPVVAKPGEQYVYELYPPLPGRLEIAGGPGALRFRIPQSASSTMLPGSPALNERRPPRPGQIRP